MDYTWNWSVFLTKAAQNETYLDWMLSGLEVTIALGLSAWVIALVVGTLLGIMRTLPSQILSICAASYVEAVRNVPLLVQFFLWYFVAPEVLPYGDAFKRIEPFLQQFIAASLCLGFFTAARVCEQVRAGIQALPAGQKGAGLALGFTLAQVYRYILLPVAFRIILPPMTSEFMNIFKNSAIASTIGLLELAAQGRQLVDYTARPYESFAAVTGAYMLINLVVMLVMRWIEARTRVPGSLAEK